MLRDRFTLSLLTSIIYSQWAFSKSEINRFCSKFFQFLLNIFDLDLGEFLKKSSIIGNWGRWSETVDVKLPDMFHLKVTWQKMLLIKVEGELKIHVGSNMSGDRKLDESMSTKLLTGSDISYCSKSMLKSPRRKIFFKFSLLSFSDNDSIPSFVKLFTCRDGGVCKYVQLWY